MSFIIPSLLRVLTGAIVLLGVSLFLNISGDTENSEALLAMGAQAKEKCITVDGKRVCLEEEGAKKKNDDDDDDKPKKKKGGDDTGLTDCTIQQSGGGGGCKTGFKRVCEKLKSGKKCCGCVPDKNAPPPPPSPKQTLGPEFRCVTTANNGLVSIDIFAANASEAVSKFEGELKTRNLTATSNRTCNPLPPR